MNSLDTAYQNSSATPRYVMVTAVQTSSYTLTGYTDSNASPTTPVNARDKAANKQTYVVMIVLPNNYYKVSAGGGGTVNHWVEWN